MVYSINIITPLHLVNYSTFILIGKIKMIPLAFILMTRRRKADYVAVFNQIKDILPPVYGLSEIQSDFELAIWSAVREAFPRIPHHGCHFHWCQAQMRKVTKIKSFIIFYNNILYLINR